MNPTNSKPRTQWILFSVLLLVGLFTGSLNCRFTQINHAPQRTGSRAVSANASLSEIAQREKRSAFAAVSTLFLFALSLAAPAVKAVAHFHERARLHRRSNASLWLPSLLFRPPPIPFLA